MSNVWFHFALTHNGTTPRMWLDGVEQTTFTVTTDKTKWHKALITDATAKATAFTAGAFIYNKSLASPLVGEMDQIRVFTTPLTPSQVTNLYQAGRQ